MKQINYYKIALITISWVKNLLRSVFLYSTRVMNRNLIAYSVTSVTTRLALSDILNNMKKSNTLTPHSCANGVNRVSQEKDHWKAIRKPSARWRFCRNPKNFWTLVNKYASNYMNYTGRDATRENVSTVILRNRWND